MPSAISVSVKLSQGELFEILPLKLILAQQANQQNELGLILKPDSLFFFFTVMRWKRSGRWRLQQSEKDKDVWVTERKEGRKERGPQSSFPLLAGAPPALSRCELTGSSAGTLAAATSL